MNEQLILDIVTKLHRELLAHLQWHANDSKEQLRQAEIELIKLREAGL